MQIKLDIPAEYIKPDNFLEDRVADLEDAVNSIQEKITVLNNEVENFSKYTKRICESIADLKKYLEELKQ